MSLKPTKEQQELGDTIMELKQALENSFTVEEIRNYIVSQDSMGDILYFLNAENIRKANQEEEEES